MGEAGVQGRAAGGTGDEEQLTSYARDLADGLEGALQGWVTRCVAERCSEARVELDQEQQEQVLLAAVACRVEIAAELRALLDEDIDAQRTTPLAVVRTAVRFPTQVLAGLGVPAVRRDEFARRAFPDDPYGLTPSSLTDLDAELGDLALAWGAAKAHVHLARRRAEGLR